MAGGNWLYFSLVGGFYPRMFSVWEKIVVDGSMVPLWALFFFGGRSQSVGIEYLLGKIVEGGFEVVCGSFFPFCSLLLSNWATTL